MSTPDIQYAIQGLGPLQDRRILELGTGTGALAHHLHGRGAKVTGLDLAETRLAVAAEGLPPPSASWVAGDAEHLPFPDQVFDAVLSRDVLMYTRAEAVLSETARVLKSGGRAVFAEALPGHPIASLYRRLAAHRQHRDVVAYVEMNPLPSMAPLQQRSTKCFYLAAIAAFGVLIFLRRPQAYRVLMRILHPLDVALFAVVPPTRRMAWRRVTVFERIDR